MRIFYSLLVMICAVILWLLPVTAGVEDFLTDVKTDKDSVTTGSGVTTGSMVLAKEIYDDDPSTVVIASEDADDSPAYVSYNSTTRLLAFSGLADNQTRILTVDYAVDALPDAGGLSAFIDKIPYIWMVCIIVFAPAALVAIWYRRD